MTELLQKSLVAKGSVTVEILVSVERGNPIKIGWAEGRSEREAREAIAGLFEEAAKMVREGNL